MKPVRVLQVVVNMNSGGIENMLMNLYRSIDKTQIQFDFLVHTTEKSFFDNEIEELGGKIHRIIPLRLNNLFKYKSALNQFFKEQDYQIVHSHISVWSYFVLSAAKKNLIPVRIAHSHESHDSIWDHRLYRIPLIFSLKKVINNSVTHRFACAKDAGNWLFGNQKFTVLNNAIETNKFIFNSDFANQKKVQLNLSGKLIFGNVGRFNTQKNHIFLIDVFKELLRKMPDAYLLLVGEGNLRKEIEAKVNSYNIKDSVSFLGLRDDVNELLQVMDYNLMPSLFEGLPVSLIEAQASGVRIFASDKISKEADITGLIDFLSIDDPMIWVNHIVNNLDYKREDTSGEIIRAGYDVKENSEYLTSFYLNAVKI